MASSGVACRVSRTSSRRAGAWGSGAVRRVDTEQLRRQALEIGARWQARRLPHGAPTVTMFLSSEAERRYRALRALTPLSVQALLDTALELWCETCEGGTAPSEACEGPAPLSWGDLRREPFRVRYRKHTTPTTAELAGRIGRCASAHGIRRVAVGDLAIHLLYRAVVVGEEAQERMPGQGLPRRGAARTPVRRESP